MSVLLKFASISNTNNNSVLFEQITNVAKKTVFKISIIIDFYFFNIKTFHPNYYILFKMSVK